jgi:hypothetical protein
VASNGVKSIPYFVEIGLLVQRLKSGDTQTNTDSTDTLTEYGDTMNLLSVLKKGK